MDRTPAWQRAAYGRNDHPQPAGEANAFSDELIVALNMILRRFDASQPSSRASLLDSCTSANLGNAKSSSVSADRKVMALTAPTSCERLRLDAARTLDTRNLPTNADAMPRTSDIVEHAIGLVKAEARKVGLWDGPTASALPDRLSRLGYGGSRRNILTTAPSTLVSIQ